MKSEDIKLKRVYTGVDSDMIEINIGKFGYIDISRCDGFTKIAVYKEKWIKGQNDPIINKIEELFIDDSQLI